MNLKLLFSFLVLYIVCLVNPCARHKYTRVTDSSDNVQQDAFTDGRVNNDANGYRDTVDGVPNEESWMINRIEELLSDDKNVLDFQLNRAENQRNENNQARNWLIQRVDGRELWTKDPANKILKRLFAAYDKNDTAAIERLSDELLNHLASANHVFKLLQAILKDCGVTSDFMPYMRNLWFGTVVKPHLPEGESSGFRHVFVGELNKIRQTRVLGDTVVEGQHSWLRYFYLQTEQSPYLLKYTGFIAKMPSDGLRDIKSSRVVTVEYYLTYSGVRYWKDKGSMIFGTGVAFDIGLYTLALGAKSNRPIHFYLGDCASAAVVAVLSADRRLYSAYTIPWMYKGKDPCPPYIQAGEQYDVELISAQDAHNVGGTSHQGTAIPVMSNVVEEVDEEDDFYGVYRLPVRRP